VPALHVPGASKTFKSFAPVQYLDGGVVQLMPTQGSPLHAPLAQPFGQKTCCDAYVHVPPEHEPTESYTERCVALAHVFWGGVTHETPMHGSPVHTPLSHPDGHGVGVERYEHCPSLQTPSGS
jgi:hypothetical protein